MPVGDLLCVVRYESTDAKGRVHSHQAYKRVRSGHEGVALRNSIVGSAPRIFVVSCTFRPVEGAARAA